MRANPFLYNSESSELDYRRHFSCEPCNGKTTGGYDVYYNQIVVCSNKYMNKGQFMGTIGHEMIHMFDACRAKLDFNNPEHVACTEVNQIVNYGLIVNRSVLISSFLSLDYHLD